MGQHTVEKIGGTSMTRFGELLDNIFIGSRKADELYNRIFVVSAYGGVTNWLLEDKKTGEPGIYGSFAAGKNEEWQEKLNTDHQGNQSPHRAIDLAFITKGKHLSFS